jgi:cell wall-associated NlpC family hydrolase
MGGGRRRRVVVGWLRLAALVSVVAVSVGAAAPAADPAALARATVKASTLSVALAGLQTRAEVLTERYDLQTSLAQQAAAAYAVTAVRLAAARTAERRDSTLLADQAAADYEADGGQSAAAAMFASAADPQGDLGALSLQQAMDAQRVDLLAASQADEIVTRLFEKQAAALLARQRADAQAASFLRLAVVAAVNRQAAAVRVAKASRSRLAVRLAAGLASAGTSQATPSAVTPSAVTPSAVTPSGITPSGITAAVLAGGPGGASPGVVAPAWSPDAGASAAQGDIAAAWVLTQLGKPYQWGAAGPASYDCSGLALEAWARAGVSLLHWTGFQWVSGPHVPLRQLRRGDLVFYATNIADPATIHHVGIYIGGGRMVDAPYTGAFVRIDSIYAFSGLIGATRPA